MSSSPALRTRLLRSVLGCLAVAALLGIAVVLGGSYSGTAGTVIASAFLVLLGCLLALAGSTVLERLPLLALAAIAGNGLGGAMLLALLWEGSFHEPLARVAIAVTTASALASLACLVLSRSRAGDGAGVRAAQLLGLAGLGALELEVLFFCFASGSPSPGSWKFGGVVAIAGIAGLIAAPIVRMTARAAAAPAREGAVPAREGLIGLRVVGFDADAEDVLVLENGTRVQLR